LHAHEFGVQAEVRSLEAGDAQGHRKVAVSRDEPRRPTQLQEQHWRLMRSCSQLLRPELRLFGRAPLVIMMSLFKFVETESLSLSTTAQFHGVTVYAAVLLLLVGGGGGITVWTCSADMNLMVKESLVSSELRVSYFETSACHLD
jgi:hypothetical protein